MRSIRDAQPLENKQFYVPNSWLNLIVIEDDVDSMHPPVRFHLVDNSNDEQPCDVPIDNNGQQNKNNINETSETSSSFSKESRVSKYTADGGFVLDANELFLQRNDPDFNPDISSSNVNGNSKCSAVDYDKDNTSSDEDDAIKVDGAVDDVSSNRSAPAKKIRRESSDF